jgi:hypothetical protein
MAKRFADTALSRESWYRRLDPIFKCAWRYLCDECDCAGVWSIDEEAMAFHVFGKPGRGIDLGAFIAAVNSDGKTRVKRLGKGKLLLAGFIVFQYGELSEACKPHKRVIDRLKSLTLYEDYRKGFQTLEDKEEDKDREKDKEEEGGVGGDLPALVAPPALDFLALYQKYPRKEGKDPGLKQCRRQIRTQVEYDALSRAIDRYDAHCKNTGQIIRMFSSFLGSERTGYPWKEWLDADAGQGAINSTANGEFHGISETLGGAP